MLSSIRSGRKYWRKASSIVLTCKLDHEQTTNNTNDELSYLSDVQQDVHKVLEGGGYVFASQAGDVLAHVATKYLVERSSFFAGVV